MKIEKKAYLDDILAIVRNLMFSSSEDKQVPPVSHLTPVTVSLRDRADPIKVNFGLADGKYSGDRISVESGSLFIANVCNWWDIVALIRDIYASFPSDGTDWNTRIVKHLNAALAVPSALALSHLNAAIFTADKRAFARHGYNYNKDEAAVDTGSIEGYASV